MVFLTGRRDHAPFVIGFGRYRGHAIDEVPEGYLRWLLTLDRLDFRLRLAVQEFLSVDRPETDDTDPDPTSAAVALPGITFRWWQAMRAEFGDDPLALEVVDAGLARLKQLCTEFTGRDWPHERGAS